MLILGIVLLVIGWLTGLHFLYVIGGLLAIVGIILLFVGGIGGRRVY